MVIDEIDPILASLYKSGIQAIEPGLWQVETSAYRLLVLLSEDRSWLRMMVPIVSAAEAEPFWKELLEHNFDDTGEVRYGLHQDALWAVFQHAFPSLTAEDFVAAIAQLTNLQQRGLNDCFDRYADEQVALIVRAAKQQKMSLDATVQNLDRFYQEGVMGDLDSTPEARAATLEAWRNRLQRLWPEIEG
ncbi:hypothetical protein [Altericista sp. CCNU0014]|uniref:hypothetical protein n=1 Tax=Altericista sp. CCNU0014 TaxID=3082949 RepID=UPI00384ADA1B